MVKAARNEPELKAFRHSLDGAAPFGNLTWQVKSAKSLVLESSIRPGGRPRERVECLLFSMKVMPGGDHIWGSCHSPRRSRSYHLATAGEGSTKLQVCGFQRTVSPVQ